VKERRSENRERRDWHEGEGVVCKFVKCCVYRFILGGGVLDVCKRHGDMKLALSWLVPTCCLPF